MPNRRDVMMPDFYPQQQQGWTQFEEDEPINMGPAASAFQQRFMQRPTGGAGTGTTPMPTSLPEMDAPMGNMAGGEPMKKGLKSL